MFDTTGLVAIADAKRLLKPEGKVVLTVADLSTMLLSPIAKHLWGIDVICGPANARKDLLVRRIKLMQDGTFHLVIEYCIPFEHLVNAHRLVNTGH